MLVEGIGKGVSEVRKDVVEGNGFGETNRV